MPAPDTRPTMAEAVKTAGRYQLLEELGRGSMGVVYKGYDPTIGRTVAVKTMRLAEAVTGLAYDELITRFKTETQAAGRLTHPNIVVVYDAGEDSGLFYITMEFVQGRSLHSLLEHKQVFPLLRVMRVVEQAGAALDFAHQHNIVHRDVKPANLMLTADDTLKMTDFGTAKILQKDASTTSHILGTPSYMSPEQVKGKPVDGRSDIFSLGVILYEMVTGEKPFPGQNVTTVIYKIVNEEPIPPRELDTSVHPGLNYVITRALRKDPEQRYQSCRELVEELRNYRELATVPSETPTVVMPGRMRPKAVEEAVARGRLGGLAAPPTEGQPSAAPPASESPTVAEHPVRSAHRPTTLPPLAPSLSAPPEERRGTAHVFVGIFLLLVLIVGGYFLWPDLRALFIATGMISPAPAKPPEPVQQDVEQSASEPQPADTAAEQPPTQVEPSATPPAPAASATKSPVVESKPAAADPDAERVRAAFQQAIDRAGLAEKVTVEVAGNEVTLTGTLTREEMRRLRAGRGRLSRRFKLIDRIEEARAGTGAGEPAAAGEPPRTATGLGEIEVDAGVMGATVVLRAPDGATQSARTPWRFEELRPGRYTLEVTKPGYRTEKKIVNVSAGKISQVILSMQESVAGLMLRSQPSQAEVYVDGRRHPELTPTTIRLSPGTYRVTVQKPGFQPHTESVELGAEDLKQMSVPLAALAAPPSKSRSPRAAGVGYVEVRSIPPGADVLVNFISSGFRTPARLELAAGKKYRITVFLKGYVPLHREIAVEENQTYRLNETLARP